MWKEHAPAWMELGLTALFLLLQVSVWKKQGFDMSLEALSILCTGALWVVLIRTIFKYRKDSRHAEDLRAAIQTLRDDHKTQMGALNCSHAKQLANSLESERRQADRRLAQERAGWRERAADAVGRKDEEIKLLRLELMQERQKFHG